MIVLIHGAWHDGSCWTDVAAHLELAGERALIVDLPIDDPALGADAYADVVEAAIAASDVVATPEPLVVVGHSLGGLVAPVLAQRLGNRAAALVLVTPLLPEPGSSHRDAATTDPGIYALGPGQSRIAPGVTGWDGATARDVLYAGVARELEDHGMPTAHAEGRIRDAVLRLRPQAWTVDKEVTPLTAWPDVPTTVVVARDDRVVAADRARARASGIPNAQVIELPGGHFPMMVRPEEVARIILDPTRRR